ncbi:MAG: hypothetical protein A2Y71_06275 [Bacteroidetes bacterium RBG_13_42_15]|nr:MAG: hypothetical protein A2Y71_06275 [Bacteroidetes bacterium RBG_13_42_15]
MKKIVFLFLLMIPLLGNAQNFLKLTTTDVDSLYVVDSIKWTLFYTEKPWSVHYNYDDFDTTTATLTICASSWPVDSALYDPVWIDNNLDGTNDNPFTLVGADTLIWGTSFPFQYRVDIITSGDVGDSCKLFWRQVRAKLWGF